METVSHPPPRPCDDGPLPRVAKPAVARYLGPVDVAPLQACIGRLSEKVWRQEDAIKENAFFCFTHTSHIVFRFIAGNRTPPIFYSNPIWEVWQAWLLPIMTRAAAAYGYAAPVYPKAILARLAAGHGIDPHRDAEPSHPFVHKIHVPLQTNPRALLIIDDHALHLEVGHAWEVNNLVPHAAFNGGAQDRIHFIFEVYGGLGSESFPISNVRKDIAVPT